LNLISLSTLYFINSVYLINYILTITVYL
jgi:hypothetical protein